jgi:polyhydroxyalkanoate synthase subunit PhaE
MSEKDKLRAADSDPALEWAKLWQTMAESSKRIFEAWSGSMAPFILARLSEKPAGFGDGNELSAAIERMAQGPRLADVWDIDRKMALTFGAWIEMRQRLASYNAVASAPWTEASKRFLETMSAAGKGGTVPDWREAFAMERNLQRGTDSESAYRRFSPGPEGAASGRIAVAKPAG